MFGSKRLNVLAYANGFTLWHYAAQGEDLLAPNYFGPANDPWLTIKGGDIIMWSDTTGARGGQMLVSVAVKGRVLVTPVREAAPVRLAV